MLHKLHSIFGLQSTFRFHSNIFGKAPLHKSHKSSSICPIGPMCKQRPSSAHLNSSHFHTGLACKLSPTSLSTLPVLPPSFRVPRGPVPSHLPGIGVARRSSASASVASAWVPKLSLPAAATACARNRWTPCCEGGRAWGRSPKEGELGGGGTRGLGGSVLGHLAAGALPDLSRRQRSFQM